MMTGVTRDGCFLVRKGKIERPVKNFRFLVSPFFLLNNLVAMGPTHRAAFGYAPWTRQEENHALGISHDWPRRPMVVPPLMVREFNFNALNDAV
jgi:predicted Zn-dependent protease